jgi:hypothetical protein
MTIVGYSIIGHWWLLMVILLMVISGDSIGGYWWLFYYKLLLNILGYIIISY